MTLVSDIITAAYRESNLVPLVSAPNTAQVTEGLNRLNAILMSSIGNEIGDELIDVNVGGDNDESEIFFVNDIVPDYVRMILNLTEETTFSLVEKPYDGQRLGIVDAAGNLDVYNLILDGNGRNIETSPTLTLSTAGATSQWMYRADLGNWLKIESLEEADEMPFPVEFDDLFIIGLAYRLNPRYGQSISPESLGELRRMRSQIRARYRRKIPTDDFNPLSTIHPWYKSGEWSGSSGLNSFNRGTWPWL